MAGPSQNWLAQGYSLLQDTPVTLPASMQAAPPAAPPPGMDPFAAGAAAAGVAPPTARAPEEQFLMSPPPSPTPTLAPVPPPAPPEAPAAPAGPPPPAAAPTNAPAREELRPNDVQFLPVGGGVAPAREVSTRGPQQNAHLMAAFDAPLEAADRIAARSQQQAANEASVYEEHARGLLAQKEAMEKVAAERSNEMRMMQADYEGHIQQLGGMKLDHNRVWANTSTGEKIGSYVLMFLGGLFQHGEKNKVEEAIDKRIDQDVEQQKFDYMRGLDIGKAKQSAFAMAMNRYQNEDAAWSAARAAAIDYTLAKVNEKAAEGRGVDATNRADELRASLLASREKTIAEGLKYIPSSVVGQKYKMVIRGQEIPGFVSESKAQEYAINHGIKPAEEVEKENLKGGFKIAEKKMEIDAKKSEKADDGAKFIATELRSAGIPRLRAITENAIAANNASPSGAVEGAVRDVASRVPLGIGDAAATAVYSDKANTRERTWKAFMNLNFHELSGAAISQGEEVRLKAALGGNDPKLRAEALQEMLSLLDAAETSTMGGASPEAQAKYRSQRDGATPGRPAAPDGVKKGW